MHVYMYMYTHILCNCTLTYAVHVIIYVYMFTKVMLQLCISTHAALSPIASLQPLQVCSAGGGEGSSGAAVQLRGPHQSGGTARHTGGVRAAVEGCAQPEDTATEDHHRPGTVHNTWDVLYF